MERQQPAAVVLGGSVAGLLTAYVLAERFSPVVIVERDRLPAGSQHRRGVPQGRQIHALLAGGQQAVEELLPGISADLGREGAPLGDPLADMQVCFNGHRFLRAPSGLTLVSASRPLLEDHIRRRVLAVPTIRLLDDCDVGGLIADHGAIRGVRVLRRAHDSVEEVITASLVVDATGRGSRLPRWLADLGYRPPTEEQLPVNLSYATRNYRLPVASLGGAYGVLDGPRPGRPRGMALAKLEDEKWMLTLVGLQRNDPPVSPKGFEEFLASVGDAEVSALIAGAQPLDDPVAFRFPASRRRRYERTAMPAGLLVVGDSLCSFNPIYGQGISVAALEAVNIRRQFRHGTQRDTGRMMRDLARIVQVPWMMTRSADRPFLTPPQRAGAGERALARYVDLVQQAATRDPVAGAGFLRVAGLVDHPADLLKPAIVRRALARGHGGEPVEPTQAPASSRALI